MNTLALKYPKKKTVSSDVKSLFKKIFNSPEGIFRGFDFGQDVDEIISKEKFKVFEKEKEYTGVSYSNSKMETIDILYFKSVFNKLNKIQVDVFLTSDMKTGELFDEVYHHFFEKFGFPVTTNDGYFWNYDPISKLSLTKIKNNVEQGLIIIFES